MIEATLPSKPVQNRQETTKTNKKNQLPDKSNFYYILRFIHRN